MKLLQSSWTAAMLGLAAYWVTTYICWTKAAIEIAPVEIAVETESAKTFVPSWNFKNPEVSQLIDDLRRRKEDLDTREQQLAEFAARLKTERMELNQVTQRVAQLQAEFDRNVVRVRDDEVGNLKKLAKTYAAMSPEGAAAIFKEMTDPQLVKILVLMKEAESGPILEALGKGGETEAKRAALVTDRLRLAIASRGASPKPKNQ